MTEIDSSPENIGIPENWKFPEKEDVLSGEARVIQVDKEQRFLSFDLPRPEMKDIKSTDYIFDPDGVPIESRNIFGYKTVVNKGGDLSINYDIDFGNNLEATSMFLERDLGDVRILFLKEERSKWHNQLGNILYTGGGNVYQINIGAIFMEKENNEGVVVSPTPIIQADTKNGFRIETWWEKKDYGYTLDEDEQIEFTIQKQDNPNEVVYLDDKGEKLFRVEWKIGEGGEDERDKGQFLFVTQTHIPTGIVKIISSPMGLDMEKIVATALSRPPYEKEKLGKIEVLNVPWRNADRVVNARLSYSHLPPTPENNRA